MKFKKNGGFTLVELIVVIAIMAILAGVAVPVYSGYIAKAEKAADLQLLGAVNSAFAAAVMEESNESASQLPDGYANFDIDAKTVSKHNDAFQKYYAGNQSSDFKSITALYFKGGVFTDAKDAFSNQIGRFEGSNYYGNVGALTGSVDNLADMLAGRIDVDGVKELFKDNMVEGDYEKFMEKYNLSEESDSAEIANAAVMYVADKLSGTTATEIKTKMGSDSNALINTYGKIPAAAMMYGLMTGYANSEYGADYTLSNPTSVYQVLSEFGKMSATEGFQEYFGAETGGGMADLDGFLAAMDVVNGYEGSFDLTNENLFISDSTNDLLESLLGSTTSVE